MKNMIGQLLSNRYLIESYVDEGGMSVVYKAVDIATNQYVAIKALKPEFSRDVDFTKRFFNEAKASYNMSHPNIVALLNVDEDSGIYYLCFEYVEGPTLKQQIVRQGIIDGREAAKIAIQILWALNHAHSKNIIHRDIKPQNIIMHPSGNAKVLDFGIARVPNSHTLTDGKIALGTVQYVSPEQASGKEITAASDIYSTGIVLYEMITGMLPFNSEDSLVILAKQLNEMPVPPSVHNKSISRSLELIILAAMQKLPENRYQNAGEMIEDLTNYLQGKPPKKALEIQKKLEKMKQPKSEEDSKPSFQKRALNSTKKNVKKHYNVFVWAIPLFLITTTIILVWGVSWISSLTKVVYAPDLQGLEHVKAIEMTNTLGLRPLVRFVYHSSVAENRVIDQNPLAQERMNVGDTLIINVSRGRQAELTPKLEGLSLTEAYAKASEQSFTLAVVERVVSHDQPEGTILNQLTAAGATLPSDRIVQVIVSGGAASVPNVLNQQLDAASNLIHEKNLTLGTVEYSEVSNKADSGKVLKQVPDADSEVIVGSKVNLVVARYPENYKAAVVVNLKNYSGKVRLRITLTEGGTEVEKHSQSVDASKLNSLRIPIESAYEGKMTVKIYIDDTLIESREVDLK